MPNVALKKLVRDKYFSSPVSNKEKFHNMTPCHCQMTQTLILRLLSRMHLLRQFGELITGLRDIGLPQEDPVHLQLVLRRSVVVLGLHRCLK